jgi:predicted transcriptional regulator
MVLAIAITGCAAKPPTLEPLPRHAIAGDCRIDSQGGIEPQPKNGYTCGMKTAVSIPDDVFEDAERLASRLRTSRSQLYARALAEFVARHDDDRVTSLMDQAVREAGGEADAFVQAAAQQALQRVEW